MHHPIVKRTRAHRRPGLSLAHVTGLLFILALALGASRSLLRADEPDQVALAVPDQFLPPRLVRDIYPGDTASSPEHPAALNSTLFFAAEDEQHGKELWKSDGTEAGTILVRDIYTGTMDSEPEELINRNGTLFFAADDGQYGTELWKSDGTRAGTSIVKDIYEDFFPGSPEELTLVGDTLYFVAYDDDHWRQLWKSDGTEAGTSMVEAINTGGYPGSEVQELTALGDTLFFLANDGTHGLELWASDGTEAGTSMVLDITPGEQPSFWPDEYTPIELVPFDGALYFRVGQSLWKSDGTPGGTTGVKQVYARQLYAFGDALFFWGADGTSEGLFKSDGTAEGTVLIKEIRPESDFWPAPFASSSGTLYFQADDGIHGLELWKSDGTTAGTVLVKDINPATTCEENHSTPGLGSFPCNSNPEDMAPFGTGVVFEAVDGVHGDELWFSDGTEGGTVLVQDINPLLTCNQWGRNPGEGSSPCSSQIEQMAQVNNTLYITADDGTHGAELWALELATLPENGFWIYLPFLPNP